MPEGTEQHLEHAEHAKHHALDPFDRRVAVTMAIIAAVLAGVTLLSHRGHTETLRLASEANIKHTDASDLWNFYQAKNIRNYEFKGFIALLDAITKEKGWEESSKKNRDFWIKQIEKYEVNAPQETKEGTKKRGDGELAQLQAKAEALKQAAKDQEEQSHAVHAAVNFLDYGHLALEMALVLCSVAVLTKLRSFWLTGILVALLGMSVASVGVARWTMPDGGHGGAPVSGEH